MSLCSCSSQHSRSCITLSLPVTFRFSQCEVKYLHSSLVPPEDMLGCFTFPALAMRVFVAATCIVARVLMRAAAKMASTSGVDK